MSVPARAPARWLLALGVAALTLLCAEGIASLLGRSLLHSGSRAAPGDGVAAPTDADRRAAALRNPGVYRVHPDPFVSYVLRADEQLEVAGCPVRSDALGLRARPGPPAAADALRLVVLGDSVAFGYGLNDDQTLACQLEQVLGTLRGPSARPIAARTVAIPGWNHHNAVSFLLDHYVELAPDIVVYLPIGNDLCDTDGLWETGHRRPAPDLANPDPLLFVGTNQAWPFMRPMREQLEQLGRATVLARLGPNIVTADISAESRRRYDDNAASIRRLQQRLQAHGGQLLLARYEEGNYAWHLERRLFEAPSIPVVPLFDHADDALTLSDDPHPNATAVRAAAQWLAADLVARGLIDAGEQRPLPAVAAEADSRRAPAHTEAEIVALSDEQHAAARAALHPVVDWRDATGLNQVYGTLNADGSAGARLALALAPAGTTLVLELQPLPGQPDLYPLPIEVFVDDQPLEPLVLSVGDSGPLRVKLPARPRADETLELRLVPARWAVQDVNGTATMVSFRPLRIACEL